MAKQITQTVAKFTTSHDRMTLTFKFPNGEQLRINSSRYRSSLSVKAPAGAKSYSQKDLQTVLDVSHKFVEGENNGQRFERIKAIGEKVNSIGLLALALS